MSLTRGRIPLWGKLVITLALGALALGVGLFAYHRYGESRYRNYLARAAREGRILTRDELEARVPVPPPEENGVELLRRAGAEIADSTLEGVELLPILGDWQGEVSPRGEPPPAEVVRATSEYLERTVAILELLEDATGRHVPPFMQTALIAPRSISRISRGFRPHFTT